MLSLRWVQFLGIGFSPNLIFDSSKNLELEQTEELHDDIQRYLSLETSDMNIDFWTVSIY